MKRDRPILTGTALKREVKSQTHWALKRVKKVHDLSEMLHDDDRASYAKHHASTQMRARRIELSLCPACHYIDKSIIAGAAMTDSNCQICGNVTHFSSTATDRLCLPCGQSEKLCIRCMSELDLPGTE